LSTSIVVFRADVAGDRHRRIVDRDAQARFLDPAVIVVVGFVMFFDMSQRGRRRVDDRDLRISI
jgi:hypothetical protein